ncbi:MAG TPA: FemAB family XrtA/PEP-CTERM system-associated protein [Gemmatimonadaceae bacterium]|nr:FemAB family XrtA/PEP-CTERM system-associated protein [Gemmatimonadaceae bacterium]
MMRVERYAGADAEWDSFAAVQPGYTHFHRFAWKRLLERVHGHECIYLAARDDDGALAAILPLVRVKSAFFGHYLVSMPFLNYGGPLGTTSGIRAVVDEAVELARAGDVGLLELRCRNEIAIDLPVSHRKITVLLDLAPTSESTFRAFDAKLRSQVRRPQKAGVTVRFGADQVPPFFSVFAHHMRDLGTPTQPESFFAAIAETFPEDAWFACAYLGDVPVAGGCGFRFGTEFELSWASSLREYNRDSPNTLVYWALMERCIDAGVRVFNFGRCTPGSGSHRFKMQWGGREEPLWWYDVASGARSTTPSAQDARFSLGPRLWRYLPTRIATALGPRIVRYIP